MSTRLSLIGLALTSFTLVNAAGFTANFDSMAEGDFAPTIQSGGINFYNLDRNLPGGGDVFCVEESNAGDLGAHFSAPNVMGFGGYVPGNGTSFGRLKSFEFNLTDPGYEMRSVELDFWTFMLSTAGNTVHLEGWKGASLVDQMSWSPTSFIVDHVSLALASDDYDRFVIRSEGPIDNGVVFANFDNVHISAQAVPEPTTMAVVGLGLTALLRRRRK